MYECADMTHHVSCVSFPIRLGALGIGFDRGLSFMLGAMSDWVYNRNPTESLHFEGPLKELKDDLASGKKVRKPTHTRQ